MFGEDNEGIDKRIVIIVAIGIIFIAAILLIVLPYVGMLIDSGYKMVL